MLADTCRLRLSTFAKPQAATPNGHDPRKDPQLRRRLAEPMRQPPVPDALRGGSQPRRRPRRQAQHLARNLDGTRGSLPGMGPAAVPTSPTQTAISPATARPSPPQKLQQAAAALAVSQHQPSTNTANPSSKNQPRYIDASNWAKLAASNPANDPIVGRCINLHAASTAHGANRCGSNC